VEILKERWTSAEDACVEVKEQIEYFVKTHNEMKTNLF
jgi:hypothetical protein